jgi:hypothetical protein
MAHEMEAIGDLKNLRIGQSAGEGIGAGSVTDEDGHRGGGLQPLQQGLSGTLLKDGHRLSAFQVDEECARGRTTAEGERIHAQHPRGGDDADLLALATKARVGAGPIPELLGHPGGHLRMTGRGQCSHERSPARGRPRRGG